MHVTPSNTLDSIRCGIVGGGVMGLQITQEFLEKNCDVTLITSRATIECGKDVVDLLVKRLSKTYEKNTVDVMIHNVVITNDYNMLSNCDLIIETSTEDLGIKQEILTEVSKSVRSDAIIATNTSAISINVLSKSVSNPERFLGIHFFNPVRKMQLVEIVKGESTAHHILELAKNLITQLGKKPVVVQDTPGFIVNHLLLPQINNAIKMSESLGIPPKDIDVALKYGLNHPMGPFELADYIGLDVCLRILDEMYQVTGDQNYKPAQTLKQKVCENKMGVKTKEGFYAY